MFFQRSCLVLSRIKDRTSHGPLPFPERASPFDGSHPDTKKWPKLDPVRTGSCCWTHPSTAYSANEPIHIYYWYECIHSNSRNSPSPPALHLASRNGQTVIGQPDGTDSVGKGPSGQPQRSTSGQLKHPRSGDQERKKRMKKKNGLRQGSSSGPLEIQGVP